MRLSARTIAAMLMGLALAAFQFESDAQSRRGAGSSSSSRSSSSVSRQRSKADFRPPRHDRPHRPVVAPHRPAVRPHRPLLRPVPVRPSYGSVIAADIAAGMAWTAVNMAYFNAMAHNVAQSHMRARQAYRLANSLGLMQTYADAGASYFYQDGVFCIQGNDGRYYVIVPPAGALVDSLPADYETIILDGREYYKVDDTIYQMKINGGKPYFEVIGQMN